MPVSDTGMLFPSPGGGRGEAGDLKIQILGEKWVELPAGSTLHLVCRATGRLPPATHYRPPLLSWTIDDLAVTSVWLRSKVMVKETMSDHYQHRVDSLLVVAGLHLSDSGTLSCSAPSAHPATVTLTVTHPRERGKATPSASGPSSWPSGWRDGSAAQSPAQSDATPAVGSAATAMLSGTIILIILVLQVGLCIFYTKPEALSAIFHTHNPSPS
ncbi:uncharacterized protein LOC123500361 [Portunus trituberculatus]|uniref:uncharacterized protein LOC123500361 n=1 Tax=Portunus trituberculatus TaxID=210409 RepID=UPI001E1CF061|nr:uncharacterized protein LOC123500361 [Portunus trituberculatus]XP_045105015.1 uncharacterized protein LOC123500361 [Portunus trituberculatus]XP_045105023.1 uncharacterized protein LOC123500361 [Portunus trituberculatus]